MAVVVWIKRHPFSEGLYIRVELEIGVVFDALGSEFSSPFN